MARTKKDIQKDLIRKQAELQIMLSELEDYDTSLERLLKSEAVVKAKESLYDFYIQAWDVFETVPFIGNWHLQALCSHLEAVFRGEIQDLIVAMPPRSSKSSIINVVYPVWCWLHKPEEKFITCAHSESLAVRDSVKARQLIESLWFQENFKNEIKLKAGVNQKSKYENTSNGYRIATSVTGRAVGEGFDCSAPETLIKTSFGPMSILDLYNSDDSIQVLSYNFKSKSTEYLYPKIKAQSTKRNRRLLRLTFEDGSFTDCTEDHKWFTIQDGFVETKNLSLNHTIKYTNTKLKIEKIVDLNNSEPNYKVYTLDMYPNGNYFVIPQGLATENSLLTKNTLIIDDPIKPSESASKVALQTVIDWWSGTMSTRANSSDSKRIVMHQRLAENDLIGHILSESDGGAGWEILNLPMEYEPTTYVTTIGWSDPRTEEGELLWPERIPLSKVNKLKKDLGSFGYSAQYQQRPVAKEGGLIKNDWIKYYNVPFNSFTARDFDIVISSWDLTFSDTGDYTVGQVWGKKGPDKFLVDEVSGKWTFTEQLHQIQELARKWPNTRSVLVEDKANGAAVIDVLRKRISGLIPINPKEIGGGDKEVRLSACALDFEAGNVYVPSHNISVWTKDWVNELTTFPKGKFDDKVDCTSQALNWIAAKVSHSTAVFIDETTEWIDKGYSPNLAKQKALQTKKLEDFSGQFNRGSNSSKTLRDVFD